MSYKEELDINLNKLKKKDGVGKNTPIVFWSRCGKNGKNFGDWITNYIFTKIKNKRSIWCDKKNLKNRFILGVEAWWIDKTPENEAKLHYLVAPDTTKWQYTFGMRDPNSVDQSTWITDISGLQRPGNVEFSLQWLIIIELTFHYIHSGKNNSENMTHLH